MAVTTTLSTHFLAQKATKKINYLTDTIDCYLMSGEFSFDEDNHGIFNTISGEVISRIPPTTLTGVAETVDDVNNRVDYSFDSVEFLASGEALNAKYATFVDKTTVDNTVIGVVNFGEMKSVVKGQKIRIVSPIFREAK